MIRSALTPRGSTRRWRILRAAILARDGGRCRYCGRPASVVDHVVPRSECARVGVFPDDPTNLVASCPECNTAKGGVFLEPAKPGHPFALSSLSPGLRDPVIGDYRAMQGTNRLGLDETGPLGRGVTR